MSLDSARHKNDVPAHVAIIMDGNRRWARKCCIDIKSCHDVGAKRIEEVLETARNAGVKCLTIYGFSLDNWHREDAEVESMLSLIRYYLHSAYVDSLIEHKVKIKVIGDISKFEDDIASRVVELEKLTEYCEEFLFQIALSYSARDEIVRATRNMCKDVLQNTITLDRVNEEVFSSYLDTSGSHALDLVIRTGGEVRLSNFLLWQSAYAEFYFTEVMWPDFGRDSFLDAIASYQLRDRRYGR